MIDCQILELDRFQGKKMRQKSRPNKAPFRFQRSIVNVSSGGSAMNNQPIKLQRGIP